MQPSETQVAAELAASSEAKAFLNYPTYAVFVGTGEGIVLWASASCKEVLGHRPEDMVGNNAWQILVAPDDIRQAATLRALLSEGDLQVWARYMSANGTRDWYQADLLSRRGLYIAAIRREPDSAMHRWDGRLRHK